MSPQELTIQIEDWLDGRLNETDRLAFEARLRDDATLAAEVALHRRLREASRPAHLATFRRTVDGLLAAEEAALATAPRTRRFSRWWLAVAAALLFLLVAAWFFWPRISDPKPAELYAVAFQPPAVFQYAGKRGQTPDRSDSTTARLVAMNDAWAKGRSAQALQIALQIAQTDTVSDNRRAAWYMAGVMALAQDQPERALGYLRQAEGIALYSEDIPWYAALAHYKLALTDPAHRPQARAALQVVRTGQPPPRPALAERMLNALP